jgi:NADP-dependent 3-hydroxy acid dehydrogenase YdfG/aryl carrier-like protein
VRADAGADAGADGELEPLALDVYAAAQVARGLALGPAFRPLTALARAGDAALGELSLHPGLRPTARGWRVHPTLLDAALGLVGVAGHRIVGDALHVLARIGELRAPRALGRAATARATVVGGGGGLLGALVVGDAAGAGLVAAGIELRPVTPAQVGPGPWMALEWEAISLGPAEAAAGLWTVVGDGSPADEALAAGLVDALAARGAAVERRTIDGEGPTPALRGAGVVSLPGAALQRGLGAWLETLRALDEQAAPRWVTLTRGAQPVGDGPVDPRRALLWGMHRCLVLEHAELRPMIVDLDPAGEVDEAGAVVAAILARATAPRIDELARRRGGWSTSRLRRGEPAIAADAPGIRPDATYLLVGGLGGLGLRTARWLADAGARRLVLASRRGVAEGEAATTLAALRAEGVAVRVTGLDVTDADAVAGLLAEIDAEGPRLRGVFHLAGVVEDGLLRNQSLARLERAVAPKLAGALHLDRLTRGRGLDHFVLYGSASALLGAPGMGGYAGANAALAAVAHARRQAGERALTVHWGLFSGVGMGKIADADGAATERGLRSFAADEGRRVLLHALALAQASVAAIPLNVRAWTAANPLVARLARFAGLVAEVGAAPAGAPELRAALAAALPADRVRVCVRFARQTAAEVLRAPSERLDVERPLQDLGLDSVMGLDLRNRLGAALGASLPATLVWTYPTLTALGGHLAALWQAGAEAGPGPPGEPVDALMAAFDAALDEVDELI